MRISSLWLISVATVAVADGISLGCYATTATDMVDVTVDDPNFMSSKTCNNACSALGKAIFVVNDKTCWCGGSIPAQSAKATPDMCNISCPGYPSESCGGKSGNTPYFNFFQATHPNGSPIANSYSTQGAKSSATSSSSGGSSSAVSSDKPSSSATTPSSSDTTSSTPSTTSTSTSTTDSSTTPGSSSDTSDSSSATTESSGSPTTSQPTRTSGTSMTSASSDAQSSASPTAGSQNKEENKDKSGGGISGGAIAGIVIGVVVGIALVGLAFFILRRRRQSYEYQTSASDRYGFTDDPFTTAAEDKMNFSHNGTSAFVPVDQRLNPALINQRRMSEGSIADEQDYSRKILRVANPDA